MRGMAFFRKLLRASKVTCVFAFSLAELAFTRPASRRDRAAWLTKFCRRVLTAADVSWKAVGPVPQTGAVVTNHLTYVDIIVHAALRPCVFVSAIEIRHLPLIGWISMMAGTVYVSRGAGGSAAKAAGGMSEGFRDGLPVVFFPEGGTSVGDEPLMPLHTGLLAIALEEDAPVTAGFLRYAVTPADTAAGKSTRDDVHWGTQSLAAHIWNFLGLRSTGVSLSFAPGPIEFSRAAYEDRKIAAEETREAILSVAADQRG